MSSTFRNPFQREPTPRPGSDGSQIGSLDRRRPQLGRASYNRTRVVIAGIVASFAANVAYVVIAASGSHDAWAAALAAAFGPLLAVAAWGLREFITLDRRRLTADLATVSLALAGTLVTAMLMVQLAVKTENENPAEDLEAVWLGLDVAWDVYLALATLLFAMSAISHPRLGRAFGLTGLMIGGGLLVLNLWSFPTPPASDGLVDLGPLVGLWFLAVAIAMLRSLGWTRDRVELEAS